MTDALVLGAAGQLGSELVRLLGPASRATRQDVSITDPATLDRFIAARRPSLVFNCAAYNAVDRAESEPEIAMLINRDGAANVAAACAAHGARVVHFSTNFVFDGELDRPYLEQDSPRPLGSYALSKLEGERRVLEVSPAALVVRTAAVYGHLGRGFPERIIERAGRDGHVEVVHDQRVNPTSAADLAEGALRLAAAGERGLVHLVAAGCCAWDEFAAAVLAEVGMNATVRPITSDALRAAAARPRNGCLESGRVAPLRPWREGLRAWAKRAKTP